MRRWWLLVALLLSVGINGGILGTLAVQHFRQPAPPAGPEFEPAPPRPGELEPPPEPGGPPPGPAAPDLAEPRPELGPLADRLGVTGESRRRFLDLQERFVAARREQRFRIVQLQAELRANLVAERPDRARVQAATQALGEAYAALDRALADNILATREILTPEQQRRFLVFVEARLRQLQAGGAPKPGLRPALRPQRPRFWPFRRRFDRAGPPPR